MSAKFEVRRLDLSAARRLLGTAIGMCPKEALFKGYIQLELDLREFDRVRTLYEKYLEFDPTNSPAWIKFTELETALDDFARACPIFELAVSQSSLLMPQLLWKAYIDFEIEEGDREKARLLYERLVNLSGHHKVWISYAEFEGSSMPVPRALREEEDEEVEAKVVEGDVNLARDVFARGYKDLKSKELKEERVVLLEAWKKFEQDHGTEDDVAKVQDMMPIARKRHIDHEMGQVVGDADSELVFADDEGEANPTSSKFFQMAHMWKNSQA